MNIKQFYSENIQRTILPGAEDELISAIAGRFDKQKKIIAAKIHESGTIYKIYAYIDGLNLSYSLIKYFVDVSNPNSAFSTDIMHNFMLSPVGFFVTILETWAIISFALIAAYFDGGKHPALATIASIWPYFRDVLKGLKNAYKGTRSVVQIANLLQANATAANYLILPLSLSLGSIAVLNRLWYRSMKESRKNQMKANAATLADLVKRSEISSIDANKIRKQINEQNKPMDNALAYLAALISGTIDSLYLYLGVMTLCPLPTALFVILTTLSVIYCLVCIATRVYEEYEFQRKLHVSQERIELELYIVENKKSLTQDLKEFHQSTETGSVNERIKSGLLLKMQEIARKQETLNHLLTIPEWASLIQGLKNGLAAYGAFSSIIFAVSAILSIFLVKFPPALLCILVLIGAIALTAFTYEAFQFYRGQRQEIADSSLNDKKTYSEIEMKEINEFSYQVNDFRSREELANITQDAGDNLQQAPLDWPTSLQLQTEKKQVKKINNKAGRNNYRPQTSADNIDNGQLIKDMQTVLDFGAQTNPKSSSLYVEGFEILRSIFSGWGKGSKSIDYTLNPFLILGDNGHYRDTPFMVVLAVTSAIVHSIILGLYAFARGFGKPPLDVLPERPLPIKPSLESSTFYSESAVGTQDKVTPDSNRQPLRLAERRSGGADQLKQDSDSQTNGITIYKVFSTNPFCTWFKTKSQATLPAKKELNETLLKI